jgi:hypothetical protein
VAVLVDRGGGTKALGVECLRSIHSYISRDRDRERGRDDDEEEK